MMKGILAACVAGLFLGSFVVAQTNVINIDSGLDYESPGWTAFSKLHGFNFGNFLEAPKEGAWGETFQEDYFPIIKNAGFGLVRVPIRWSGHVGPAPDFTIDPTFLARVDWVVANVEKYGLVASLDYQNDEEIIKEPEAYTPRYLAIWKQIAEHFKDAPKTILFELMNEPHDKLDAAKWNKMVAEVLPVIRTSNPTRTIIVGPYRWNNIGELKNLVLPESDRNLVVTVHFYDPMTFTHQGAEWVEPAKYWLGTKWMGTEADKKPLADQFDEAAEWGKEHHRPIYLGEFGSYSKGDMDSRVRWTTFIARTAEAHGMPWTYWEFCDGFGAYDKTAKAWREPLLNALKPKQ